jgi:acetyltransferase-like isoleucine patch superfamily enzyme
MRKLHKNRDEILAGIFAKEVVLGAGVVFGENVQIGSPENPLRRVEIGDDVYIGADSTIISPEFKVLDYSKLHNGLLVYGKGACSIGYNAWVGQNTVLDSMGDLKIGNNCGIGAASQLWSHILYGDVMEGCRFDSVKASQIGNDVWFVGHCVVSPITAEDKSMAMVGSVVTRDMKFNHVYAGVPAADVTDKVGPQFREVTPQGKLDYLEKRRKEFFDRHREFDPSRISIGAGPAARREGITYFDVISRTYSRMRSREEIEFIQYCLPRAKFIPAK